MLRAICTKGVSNGQRQVEVSATDAQLASTSEIDQLMTADRSATRRKQAKGWPLSPKELTREIDHLNRLLGAFGRQAALGTLPVTRAEVAGALRQAERLLADVTVLMQDVAWRADLISE